MSNIDEKAKNDFTIEMRIFENYEKVKHEIFKAMDFLEHSGYKKYIPHRIKVLKLALKDLERIKEEYGKD